MIIKKPYAFLIKNFRLIHGILFIMLLYLLISSVNIYGFFSGYASNNYYVIQTNLAQNYVNTLMYVVSFLVIVFSTIVYYLLEVKNKGNKMYLFISLYSFILFVYFIYITSVFNGLESASLSTESVRAFRDISLIVFLPNIVFVFVIFARALGFNLKQFDFKKDLEDLQIDESDSEEIELTLTDNSYKIKRTFRKIIRLSKYFFLENKIFVITVASIIVLILTINMFRKINIYTDAYNQNQNIVASALVFKVSDSYITNTDMSNVVINKNKSYILVKVNISNKSMEDFALDNSIFKLNVNDKNILPVLSMQDKFIDIGNTYIENEIKSGEDKVYIVVFEVNTDDVKNEYVFKIKDLSKYNITYKDVIINPNNIDDSKDMGTFNIPNEIELNETVLKDTKFNIGSYDISNRFKEEYTYTTNDGKNHKAVYSIIPTNKGKGETTIIKIKGGIVIDKNINASKYLKDASDFLYYYGFIRYRYMGYYKNVKLSKMNLDFTSNENIYMELPKEVENATKIELILLIRGIKYTIILK